MKLSNRNILILIIAVSAFLRFYRFTDIPYMHDEFSALFRTGYNTFSSLIENGVRPDGHPAGIQVFLYFWTKLTGQAEWIVKLPFTIMGLLSVALVYLVAKRLYNETTGLICAAYFAALQYTVMYSQIARPYISGLFFSLSMVYFWVKLMDSTSKSFWRNGIPYVLASALCAYNHHFSLLFAAMTGFSGLFLIPRRHLARYILLGIIIFILYIPHLGIFVSQLGTGGVGGWLGKPDPSFFIKYPYYIFNFSLLSVMVAAGIIFYGFKHRNKSNLQAKYYLLFSIWFLLPLLTGYLYSVYFNPVLQYSVLLFSFFPLLFVLFGHIPLFSAKTNLVLVILILGVNAFTLIYGRRHYRIFYESVYEHIILDHEAAKSKYGAIAAVIDSHDKITQWYLEKHQINQNFSNLNEFPGEAAFIRFLEEQSNSTDFLYFGGLSTSKPNTVPIILQYFPAVMEQNNYFGGTTWLFSKNGSSSHDKITTLDFENSQPEGWRSVHAEKIIKPDGLSAEYAYLMDSLTEWSPTYTGLIIPHITHKNNFIDVTAVIKPIGNTRDVILVATLEAKGEVIHFSGAEFDSFYDPSANSSDWVTLHHAVKLADIKIENDSVLLNVFVWNKSLSNFLLDNLSISIRKGNPIMYGLYEKIP